MIPILVCNFLLENKAYHQENSTEEDVKAIKSRISILDQGIIQYVELPIMTDFSTNLLFDELERCIDEGDIKALFFDLTLVQVPTVKIRKLIIKRFEPIVKKVDIMSFATGKSSLVNIAIKFILNVSNSAFYETMFVSTKEEAMADIYEQLGKK